jgi:histidinol-phosphate aminotransferase
MRTFSKAYGMAGLRVGYAIGEQNIILNFEKIRNHFGMCRVSQVGALAALDDNIFINDVIQRVGSARKRISDIALSNNCKFVNSYTNFIAIDCLKDDVFAKKVLENLIKKRIFVRMPYSFPQNRCIRVTVGLDKDIDLFEKYFPIALKES